MATVNDLVKEIRSLKDEVKEMKSKNFAFEMGGYAGFGMIVASLICFLVVLLFFAFLNVIGVF